MGAHKISKQQNQQASRQALYRPAQPCLVCVQKVVDVSENLRRITFTGEDISNFPAFCPGAHIKVFLPLTHQQKPQLPITTAEGKTWLNANEKPNIRTYSVRNIRTEQQEIDIEFVLHGDTSPASSFAKNANKGDVIGLSRPSGPDPMVPDTQYFNIAGDLTALPAIAAMLEVMPATTRGQVRVSVLSEQDCILLTKPKGIQLKYYINNTKGLITEMMQETEFQEDCHFWVAGEESLVVPIRRYLLKEIKIKKNNLYAIPYWRQDQKEEDYHQTRHDIMDQI